jgi:hypothetical protein
MPQFFFLIELASYDESSFKDSFRKSQEGTEEFRSSFIQDGTRFLTALSPEFMANLFYAFEYFQAIECRERQEIDLS